MADVTQDENGNDYPSVKGALEQLRDAAEYANDFSWYSFKPVEGNPDMIKAISYDDAGEPSKVYLFKLTLAGEIG